MILDVSKLTPEPWTVNKARITIRIKHGEDYVVESGVRTEDDAEFIVLARKAFGVMMRRGWKASRDRADGQWYVSNHQMIEACVPFDGTEKYPRRLFPDPFTALVEADRWYSENVEKK